MSGEIMVQKPLDQSGCTISYKRFLRYEVEFLYVIRHLYYRSNKFTFSFQLGVVRHDWACSKLCQIMSQLYLNMELSYKAGFLHVVRDPSKLQIYLIISSECDQVRPKLFKIMSQLYLKNELLYDVDFFACV